MTTNLIIGNSISFVAALFMAASCCVNDRHRVFLLQAVECALLCVASIFFGSWSGITTLALGVLLLCHHGLFHRLHGRYGPDHRRGVAGAAAGGGEEAGGGRVETARRPVAFKNSRDGAVLLLNHSAEAQLHFNRGLSVKRCRILPAGRHSANENTTLATTSTIPPPIRLESWA